MDPRSLQTLEYDKIIKSLSQLAMTELGRQLCEQLEPVSDLNIVLARQDETEDATREILERGSLPLEGVKDIRPSVHRALSGAVLTCTELLLIGTLLRTVDRLRTRLPKDRPPNRIIEQMINQLRPASDFAARIDEAIAGDNEVKDQASLQLMNIRRRIRAAQNDVKESLNRIVRSHARALQDQLVTIRNDRYVVPVKAEYRGEIPGLIHDTSSSGATLFVEPLPVVELNNKIRELVGLEREEINRILQELSEQAADIADLLLHDLDLISKIDAMMARGKLALEMQAIRPILNTKGQIRLIDARHPLIPKERVVPIQFELGIRFNTLVITGPNTGGKTVALKTCGLLCLMAMAGLMIPARSGSEVSLFEEVLADIGDEQSIEQDLSTFSSHMRNLVYITKRAGPGKLVLLDELGSGTDPSEGAALAIAILDDLRQSGCLTVATTHYKELKGYALQTPGVENACCEFDAETLKPTYRLLIGVPGVSNAFAISSRLGLSDDIICRAKALMSEEGVRFEELARSLEQNRSKAEQAKREAEALKAEARDLAEQLRSQNEKLNEQKRLVIREARQEARALYTEALEQVEQLLEEVREKKKEQDLAESHRLALEARQEIRAGLKNIHHDLEKSALSASGRKLSRDELKTGHTYSAPALGLTGRLIEGPDSRGYYTLQSGDMKVTVPQEALRALSDTKQPVKESDRQSKRLTLDRHLTMQSEIYLLGETVEEATVHLDKFIDDAILAGIKNIRIVHGKGTGALRSAVSQMLRRDPRVKQFRLGAYGEGDSGVTIAELK